MISNTIFIQIKGSQINITSPLDLGPVVWTFWIAGTTKTISWTSAGLPNDATVTIELHSFQYSDPSGKTVVNPIWIIADSIPNSGNFLRLI